MGRGGFWGRFCGKLMLRGTLVARNTRSSRAYCYPCRGYINEDREEARIQIRGGFFFRFWKGFWGRNWCVNVNTNGSKVKDRFQGFNCFRFKEIYLFRKIGIQKYIIGCKWIKMDRGSILKINMEMYEESK